MQTQPENDIRQIPAFSIFVDIVANNIGAIPEIRVDENDSAHRIQLFRGQNPKARIIFSKRALVRYKAQKDVLDYALVKRSSDALTNGACLLIGKDLMLTNRFAGSAFITYAFTKVRSTYIKENAIFAHMLQGIHEDDPAAIISFFHPLAHEIGHTSGAQDQAPSDINSDKLFDTYDINYKEVWPIIGSLDYKNAQKDKTSPLYLPVLREEAIADWFAVTAVFNILFIRNKNGQFNLLESLASVIMFSMVNLFGIICVNEWESTKRIQEQILAYQCRFSILIDSMRAITKTLFPKSRSEIDVAIIEVEKLYQESFAVIWKAGVTLMQLKRRLFTLTEQGILDYIRDTTPSSQWIYLHLFLSGILEDSKGYALTSNNKEIMQKLFDGLRASAK